MGAEEDKPRFLTDSPIEDIDEDDFGHREYVDTLERMIEDVAPPWNIGVFGEWGSGKTSIIRMLFSRLRESNPDYVCVEFDAWKHAEESIRTDLLLNLDREIGEMTGQTDNGTPAVLGEDRITRELYDVEEEQQGENLSAWQEAERIYTESPLVGGTTLLILGIIIVGAIVNLLNIVGLIQITDPTLSSINSILSAFLFPLFVSVFIFMAGEVRQATTALRRKHPRKEWSGAYEQLFDEILDQTDAEKVLISIDNLDRCESDTVYDVLVSLKTFLQSEACIYIIPCDDQALQSHIESIDTDGDYFEDYLNEREFLRKFFQSHIRIPDFIVEDIEEYAESQNQELAKPFDDAVLDVITKAHVRNPRRIKQSLNRLTTLRILSEQMEEAGHLSSGRLTDNLDFLAKVMVLEEDYHSFYNELQSDPRLLEDVGDYFPGNLSDRHRRDRIEELLGNDGGGVNNETELERFLRSTRHCTVDNPKPFLKLGEPSFASKLSDMDSFIQNLRTNQEEEVREELLTIKQDDQPLSPYLDAIGTALDDYTQEGREGPLFSTIDTLLAAFDEFEEDDQEDVARVLGDYLVLDTVQNFYSDYDPDEFFSMALKLPDIDKTPVFNRFAETVISNREPRENVLKVFIENAEEVPRAAAKTFCSTLLDLRDEDLQDALETLSRREESKNLATPNLLRRAARFASWNGNQNRFEDTQYYTQFDSQAGPRGRGHFVSRIIDIKNDVDDDDENQYYNQLRERLNQLGGQVTRDTGSQLFRELKQRVSASGQDSEMVKVAINFYNSYDPATRGEFKEWIADLFRQWNQRNIQRIINHASDKNVDVLDDEEVVANVIARVPDTLSDADWVACTLISAIPQDYDDQIVGLAERLSEDDNHTENIMAAKIFMEHPERLQNIQDVVLECCQRQIHNANNTDQKKTYLQAEAVAYDQLDDSDKEGFVNRLDSLLTGEQNDHRAFQEIWGQIEQKVKPERRTTVARNLRNQFQSELRENIQPNQLFPLVDAFSSLVETGDVDEDDGEWVVERLTGEFEGNNLNHNHVSTLIEKLAGFSKYYGREEQTLTRIESLIGNNNTEQIHQSAEKLLNVLEKSGDLDEERIGDVRDKLVI